jgi:hypothetical protein
MTHAQIDPDWPRPQWRRRNDEQERAATNTHGLTDAA